MENLVYDVILGRKSSKYTGIGFGTTRVRYSRAICIHIICCIVMYGVATGDLEREIVIESHGTITVDAGL